MHIITVRNNLYVSFWKSNRIRNIRLGSKQAPKHWIHFSWVHLFSPSQIWPFIITTDYLHLIAPPLCQLYDQVGICALTGILVAFHVWLLSLNIMLLRFIYVVPRISTSLFLYSWIIFWHTNIPHLICPVIIWCTVVSLPLLD